MQKRRKMFCLHHCRVFTRCCFKFRPVRGPFSKSTVFEICRQNMCRFHVNGRPIRHIFHRFKVCLHRVNTVLDEKILFGKITNHVDPEVRKVLVNKGHVLERGFHIPFWSTIYLLLKLELCFHGPECNVELLIPIQTSYRLYRVCNFSNF